MLTVRQVAERICKKWGGSAKVKALPGKHPHEAGLLMLDINKAKKELGWSPKMSAVQAIDWTVEGYWRLVEQGDARAVVTQQINSYKDSL